MNKLKLQQNKLMIQNPKTSQKTLRDMQATRTTASYDDYSDHHTTTHHWPKTPELRAKELLAAHIHQAALKEANPNLACEFGIYIYIIGVA